MARVSIWPIIMFAMVLCLLLYYLIDPPLQENLGKLYYFTSRGSHYWNKFKLPSIPERFYLFRPCSHIESFNVNMEMSHKVIMHLGASNTLSECIKSIYRRNDGEQGRFNEANIAEEKEKSKVIEAAEESLEKTKMIMEDSAKTAAEMVGEAVHKTADIVKTFSKPTLSSQPQDEL